MGLVVLGRIGVLVHRPLRDPLSRLGRFIDLSFPVLKIRRMNRLDDVMFGLREREKFRNKGKRTLWERVGNNVPRRPRDEGGRGCRNGSI